MSLYKFAYTDVKMKLEKEKKFEGMSLEELEKLLNEKNDLELFK